MKTNVSNLYLDWLFNVIRDGNGWKVKTHRNLIQRLHTIPFVVKDPKDQPRENDGIDLRWRFAWEHGHMGDELIYIDNFDEEKCSVLEMMVALAFRTDESFTRNSSDETTVSFIFWNMIKCMGLLGETDNVYDDEYVILTVNRFNNREYEKNGHGGLFLLRYDDEDDMRCIDIWTQLCIWVNENFTW